MQKLLLALVLFTLIACNDKPEGKILSSSSGALNTLTVVMPNDLWAGSVGESVREKLAGTLLDLMKSHGRAENGQIRIDLKLTRQELASLIGTATETLIRVLSEFKEEGLVELQGKNIYILNLDKLELVA